MKKGQTHYIYYYNDIFFPVYMFIITDYRFTEVNFVPNKLLSDYHSYVFRVSGNYIIRIYFFLFKELIS